MVGNKKLEFEIVGDASKSKACLIFFHGWKGNKNSFKPFVKSLKIKDTAWYLPQAPYLIDKKNNAFSWTYEISKGNRQIFKLDHIVFVIGYVILIASFWEELVELLIISTILFIFTVSFEIYTVRKNDLKNS